MARKQSVQLGSHSALTATMYLDSDEEDDPKIVSRSVEKPKREYFEKKKRPLDMLPPSAVSQEDTSGLVLDWKHFLSALGDEVKTLSSTLGVLKLKKDYNALKLVHVDAQLADCQKLL